MTHSTTPGRGSDHRAAQRRTLQRALILGGGLTLLACLLAAMLSAAASRESQWLGMEMEPLTPGLRAGLGLSAEQSGVYVSDVVGAALQSGVREGDVIVAVSGRPVQDLSSLRQARRALGPGESALLTINRMGSILSVPLSAVPVVGVPAAAPLSASPPALVPALPAAGAPALRAWGPASRVDFGADLTDLTAAAASSLGLQQPARGVLVAGLASGLAAQAGMQRGDLILHLNGFDVVSLDQFWSLLASQPLGSTVSFDLYRSGRLLQLSLVAGEPATTPQLR